MLLTGNIPRPPSQLFVHFGAFRFAQPFISPLFTQSATDREVKAVDSEHSKNVLSDLWRLMQLQRDVFFNPAHPASHFGTGNAETLKRIPREKLLEFHEKWYSANIMKLCVLGRNEVGLAALPYCHFTAAPAYTGGIPGSADVSLKRELCSGTVLVGDFGRY